ncbi:MAG: tetratricopeptide repeat protein [Saprospiraceae bacterium]|nr:tetratricopeptide repeat protein [Saprospiraceae bacterium]
MKSFYLSVLLSVTLLSAYAQTSLTQNGLVREQNSGKKAVADVQIIFSNAQTTVSDKIGKFVLTFPDKKAGDIAFRADIAKKGYELVNEKEVEQVRLSQNNAALPIDVIVAKAGTISSQQRMFSNLLESTLKSSYDDKKRQLRIDFQNRQLLKQAYQDQYEALQKQYAQQKRDIFRLADKYARVNIDDVESLYKETFELFKEGKTEDAIKKMETAGLMQGFLAFFKEKKNIKNPADSMRFMASKGQILTHNLAALNLQAELYVLNFDKSKAELLYDQIFSYDSTNLDILRGCAEFYRLNLFYDKAINAYSKILVHPKAPIEQKQQAFVEGGDVLMALGEVEDALSAYMSAKNIVFQWVNKEAKNAPFLRNELGSLYLKAGTANLTLSNTDKALVFFKSLTRVEQEIMEFYPNNVAFKKNLSASYERLGKLYTMVGDFNKSIEFYALNKHLRQEIYDTDRLNLEAKESLALAFERLGTTQMGLNQGDKALLNFDNYFTLKSELFDEDRLNVETKNSLAMAHAKLGNVYSALKKYDKAIASFSNYNRLAKELLAENINSAEYKNSLAQAFTRLAETYVAMENPTKALSYYEERLKLGRELAEAYPNNVSYKNNLAVIYSKIGNIHTNTGDFDIALAYYMKDVDISRELFNNAPNNAHFKNSLAISYSKLGTFYREKKNDISQAHIYFEKSKSLLSELATNAPNSVDYKNNLKWVEEKLAEK